MKKNVFFCLTAMIIILYLPMTSRAEGSLPNTLELDEAVMRKTYTEYLQEHTNASYPEYEVTVSGTDFVRSEGDISVEYLGDEGLEAVVCGEDSSVTWELSVPAAGMYHVKVDYFPIKGKGGDIERRIMINGSTPFSGAGTVVFYRSFRRTEGIKTDSRGNEIRPDSEEKQIWMSEYLRDSSGIFNKPYAFYLEEGINEITITAMKEPMGIGTITICQADELDDYGSLQAAYVTEGYQDAATESIILQGELADETSNASIYAISDKTSALTQNASGENYHSNTDLISKNILNSIGGTNWKWPGQRITWEFSVPEDGLYQIGIKYIQNLVSGMAANRKLLIDGVCPFAEVESISFAYGMDWENLVLADAEGNPYRFYLQKGVHTVSLEVILPTELGNILDRVDASVTKLNEAYRELLVIIGATPDTMRDYDLERKAAGAIAILGEQNRELMSIQSALKELFDGVKGMNLSALEQLVYQTGRMYEDADDIPSNWSTFKDNIVALGSWAMNMQQQPLTIDYLMIGGADFKMPRAEANFWERIKYEVIRFASSFVEDYTTIGDSSEDAITVWVLSEASGRDQTQILRQMIDESFTPDTDIPVNLQLVSGSVLLSAVLAGEGPDVALHVGNSDPMNYALRNAVYDLTQFEDYEEVVSRFYDASLVPYRMEKAVYALPETMDFLVMFYRADILADLGIEIPRTWDEFYVATSVIQNNNMQVGLPATTTINATSSSATLITAYSMFLNQNQCDLYSEGGRKTNLSTEPAIEAFQTWTEMFTDYGLPVVYDLANRFRTGEMPLAVSNYTSYNYLSVFAPEIKGLWGFTLVPGTVQEDGSVDHTSILNGSACFILNASEKKEDSWEFLKWWTSLQTQDEYGNEIENLLGPSGRLATANKEAMEKLPWTQGELNVLKTQLEWVQGIPEVPGGYMTSRHIMNAFYSVYNNNENPREVLEDYALTIDNEITNKRIEFGLPVD